MGTSRLGLHGVALLLGAFCATALAGCGGGGTGFAVTNQSLVILTTQIAEPPQGLDSDSTFESTDAVDWEIPLDGGCGGPYLVRVLSGTLPDGIEVLGGRDPDTQAIRHHIRGILLQEGTFRFRLEVVDTACNPFSFAVADFVWEVGRGTVAIVDAVPALHPPGTYDKGQGPVNPDYPALDDTLYGQFAVHRFLVAGGQGPYVLELVDDPNNPDDGTLPLGVVLPAFSDSLVGAPQDINNGNPFVISIRAQDVLGQYSEILTFQWEITTPPIVITDAPILPTGKCGSPYSYSFTIRDGVPPFLFDLVRSDVNRNVFGEPDVVWQPPLPPIILPATALIRTTAAHYPVPATLAGPDYRSLLVPPEGIRLGDGSGGPYAARGSFAGTPRRRGQFAFHLHVKSELVPNSRGQHEWKRFEVTMDPSEPPTPPRPAFDHDPSYTVPDVFAATPPYSPIPDAEVELGTYNPDAATHAPAGLQLLARGGVRKDGLTDAPHGSDVVNVDGVGVGQEDGSTPGGGYTWAVNANPAGDGDTYTTMPPGVTLDTWIGVWRVSNPLALVRQQAQGLEFTVTDQQLPTPNTMARRVSFAVGPDKMIITESTTSGTTTTGATWWDMNDGDQTFRVCLPYSAATPVFRDLVLADLAATHTVPATTGLAGPTALHDLLKKQDPLRVAVNPAGWWNDVHNLHPWGARSGIHADRNSYETSIWGENDLSSATDYSRQPSITAVEVPAYRSGAFNAVSHSPTTGVYTDGGKMYPFANGTYFGVVIVRNDASLYVPFAISTTTSVGGVLYQGFGDGVMNAWAATGRSQLRVPHMAVSPDGRFAAMKIKTQELNYLEAASTTKIVVFSLTGEKAFGVGPAAQTWCIVDSGSNGTTAQGVYLYAPSIVMTNSHMYWLCGNLNGTLSIQTAAREHFVYRFQFANATTGAVVAGTTGTGALCPKADALETNWTNTAGSPLQTRFQLYSTPLVSGFAMASAMHFDGLNQLENSLCPIPFRVSADGRSIAILAMPDQPVANVNSQAWHVWVDFQGAGVRRLSSAARHITGGAARGYTLARGSSNNTYENWHRYGGPTPHLEISDNGSKVAVVVNRFTGTPTYTSPTTAWVTASSREDVIAYRTADNVNWTEIPITNDAAGSAIISTSSSALWRFGCLTFTEDNAGLVFWGGCSSWWAASTTSTFHISHMYGGTLYGADISTASTIGGISLTSLLASADGGATTGVATYTVASPYNPTHTAGAYTGVMGVIKPYGGFLSRNRRFLYIVNKGAITANGNDYPLVGVNIRSTNTALNVNGRTDFRGFSFSTWPLRRGFIGGTYNYFAQYGLSLTDYPAYRRHGMGMQIMPSGTGWVLFGSQYQSSGPSVGTASSSYGGPVNATYSYDYSAYGGEIEGFDADVAGPIVRLSSFASDTAIRRIHFLKPAEGGGSLAYVYDTYSTSNGSPSNEQLHHITGIGFNASTGASLGPTTRHVVHGTATRISDAIAFGSAKNKLYYAEGTTNENAKTLKEATFNGAATTIRNISSTPKRYNIIHVAR
jgi:hypothetical protein